MKPTQILSLTLVASLGLLAACSPPPVRPIAVNMGGGGGYDEEASPKGKKKDPIKPDNTPDSKLPETSDSPETKPMQEVPKTEEKPKTGEMPKTPEVPKPQEMPKNPEPTLRELLTEAQFNSMLPLKIPFYTYAGFMEAAEAVGGFAKEGTTETRKREIAAILANARHESDEFQAVNEYNTAKWGEYCMPSATYPCASGKTYHGRGPIQLSWNYNYKDAGKDLGLDLLNNPDLVASSPKVAFQTMMWFWMKRAKNPDGNDSEKETCHDKIVKGRGFGATIMIINGGLECVANRGDDKEKQVQKRIANYNEILKSFGLNAGNEKLDCI